MCRTRIKRTRRGIFSNAFREDVGKDVLETLNLIEKNPKYTTEQIAEIRGKATRTIERHIAKLKGIGILVRKGGTFGGYWEVKS